MDNIETISYRAENRETITYRTENIEMIRQSRKEINHKI
jgi:hypothetical protein